MIEHSGRWRPVYHPRMGWISGVFAHKVIDVATGDEPDGGDLRSA
ncbi:MAG: hypothetical protein AAGC60_23510 [Acidobacteriota bacterium]